MITVINEKLRNKTVTVSKDISETSMLQFDENGHTQVTEEGAKILSGIPDFSILIDNDSVEESIPDSDEEKTTKNTRKPRTNK